MIHLSVSVENVARPVCVTVENDEARREAVTKGFWRGGHFTPAHRITSAKVVDRPFGLSSEPGDVGSA